MIIYTNAFALSDDALDKPIICYDTRTRDAGVVVSVSSESAAGPKDAPLRQETHEYWEPTSVPATWKLDMGANRDIDYVAIAAHDIGSEGADVEIETSLDDAVWTPFASNVQPADDAALIFLDTLRSARYIRVTIDGEIARMGVVYAGLKLRMQTRVIGGYSPITMSRDTDLDFAMSEGGHFLGAGFRRHGLKGSITFQHMTAAWVRANLEPFIKSARENAYFIAWNPLEFPLEAAFVWTEDDIVPQYMGRIDYMEATWSMRGIGNV